ncbi:hypothetical protein K402DRAFT_392963 [Aulographum hederae CBS 113979]|uniref:Uncharacterized protein n=1 Tax=Aulographum hederae CBS 113979 TaxID=1176131 RepID=A0A6G1H220_9PEZI|nr:hypothetical protein K402DRAFT_392963 [Aulographum hederae CBS 113979]
MKLQSTFLSILLTVLSLSTLSLAASSATFCKCTCFTNSTIIDLNGATSTPTSSNDHPTKNPPGLFLPHLSARADSSESPDRKTKRTCNDCNRQFCLSYNLPICKGAEEKDVFATCFQRDSAKDQAVVFIFIFATVGLLGWAGARPWIGGWIERMKERQSYIPISNQGDH